MRKVATPEEKAAKAAAKVQAAKVYETLDPATRTYRDQYVTRAIEIHVEILNNMRKTMAENGMDLNKVAPYPKTNIGRTAYQIALSLYHKYTAVFEPVKTDGPSSRIFDDKAPYIVVERAGAEEKVRSDARHTANGLFEAFLYKMADKIGKLIVSAEMTGRLWDGCNIKVVCTDGETQNWKTQCIMNRSIYNNFFNQWPTRRVE